VGDHAYSGGKIEKIEAWHPKPCASGKMRYLAGCFPHLKRNVVQLQIVSLFANTHLQNFMRTHHEESDGA
jgi:hypothetical protein